MLDEAHVGEWLADHVGLALPADIALIAGGHSCLTFTVTGADGTKYALRRPPLGHTLATAHDVLREHRIISALAATPVPVAPAVAACDDLDVTGAPFYVMAFVEGVVLHEGTASTALAPDARRRAGESMIDVMAALHAVDPDAVGLGDLAKRTDYLGRQLKRWAAQWAEADTRPMPRMDELHDWLVANQPAEGTAGIAHGDFRLGNAIHHADGTVAALLDWELCTFGPAMADLSYFLRAYVDADGWSTGDELVARYRGATGLATDDLPYWLAFHAWRSACIVAGVFTRYKHGNMGRAGDHIEVFEDSVEAGMNAGLEAAGIA